MNPLATSCTERPLVQVDVFTAQDLETFITQSRARDQQLDAKDKTLLHIQPGARFVQPLEADVELAADEAAIFVGGDAGDRWVQGRRGTIATVDRGPLTGFTPATRAYGNGAIFVAAVRPSDGSELTLEQYNALSPADKQTYTQRKVLTPTGGPIWIDRTTASAYNTIATPGRVWSQFPLQVSAANGESAAYSRVLSIKSASSTAKEADGTRWFHADAGTANGRVAQGWAREKDHPNVVLCSPWAWPGFVLMDTGNLQPKDLYARAITQNNQAQSQERGQMEALSQSAGQSPLFSALCEAIDADDNGRITPLELRRALGTPWLAQALSRLVIEHNSEWAGPMDRWSAIDELIPESRKEGWTQEKKRIEALQFWDEVKGKHGFPAESRVHHLHPVGFVENFATAPCYCHRDLTEEDLREIILAMRQSERDVHNAVGERLFTETNISMPEEDKNYRRLAEEINAAFNQFEINTCIRKIHFLAQAYWEADRLRTTKEYGTGHRYAPYVGRGLMQLTWESGYKKYESFSGLGCVDAPDLVSNSLHHSVRSAAWYWNQGKELSLGTNWTAPAGAPEYVRRHNPSYPKRTITYTYAGRQTSYGTIDLNLVADDDYVDVISWLVNGGSNGLSERRVYVNRLKEIMSYEASCISRRE